MIKQLFTILFLFYFVVLGFGQESKQEQKESNNPKSYLDLYNCERYVPILGKSEYYFDIANKGSVVTYYEIVVKITFKNKNYSVVGEEFHTLKGSLDPKSYKRFPVKSSEPNPLTWKRWSYEIVTANSRNENISRGLMNDLD